MFLNTFIYEKPKKETKMWRYVDLPKFMSLLEYESLFFARVDQLDDEFEGSLTHQNVAMWENALRAQGWKDKEIEEFIEGKKQFARRRKKLTYVNCWHLNDVESVPMWDRYTLTDYGIAIQTTCERLESSFCHELNASINIGKVRYIDYATDLIEEDNPERFLLIKRKTHAYEREVRAIFIWIPILDEVQDLDAKKAPQGHHIEVNLNTLIDKIYISHRAPSWFQKLISDILERYSLNIEVKKSVLTDTPLI